MNLTSTAKVTYIPASSTYDEKTAFNESCYYYSEFYLFFSDASVTVGSASPRCVSHAVNEIVRTYSCSPADSDCPVTNNREQCLELNGGTFHVDPELTNFAYCAYSI
jgi:hypothetical protein